MTWKVLSGTVAAVAFASVALNSGLILHDNHGSIVDAAERNAASRTAGPQISGCPVLPADNVWNTPIDQLPKAAESETYLGKIGLAKALHPDFGPEAETGIPFAVIRASQKRVKVEFDNREDSDLGNYPLPGDASIEGGPSSTGDRHVLLIDQDRCMLFETWDSHPNPDGTWKVGSGIKIDLTDNALRAEGKTSADAAGLPILPGLIRYEEVEAGEIRHALRFTAPQTQKAYIWPARHFASKLTDKSYPPMGVRLRLKKSVDISRFPKDDQVILTALRKYGMFLADNGGAFFISGVPDPRWNSGDIEKLKQIKGSDFEMVDEADWQFLADSGRVDPVAKR